MSIMWILYALTRLSPVAMGFSVVDFTHLEEAAHRAQEENDDWVDTEEPSHGRFWKPPLAGRKTSIGSWRRSMGRPFSGALGAYIRNLMDLSSGQAWPMLFNQALGHFLKDGVH